MTTRWRALVTAPIALSRTTIVSCLIAGASLPLYVLFPTAVGLNGDLERYGRAGFDLLCGDGRRVWSNYQIEPLFVAILFGFSEVWAALTGLGAGACANPGLQIFWLPIALSATVILGLMVAVRHLGANAFFFHLVFCLETVLMMLPFNLLRQFLAVGVIMVLVPRLVRKRLSPVMFCAGLVPAALIHWSVWPMILVGLCTLGAVELSDLRHRPVSRLQVVVALLVGLVGLAVVGYAMVVYVLPRFQLAAFGPRGLGWSLTASVRGMFSPITIAVVTFGLAIGLRVQDGFVRTFAMLLAILYVAVAVSGNISATERMRALILPTVYFVFVYLVSNASTGVRWRMIHLVFVGWAIFTFTWHAVITRPFATRPSFTQLFQ